MEYDGPNRMSGKCITWKTRNSVVADKPRDAFVQMQWRGCITSVIKIRLEKNWFIASGLSRSLNVIGTDTDRSVVYDFLLVFYNNFVPKTFDFKNSCDFDNRITGPSRSLEMSPFDRTHTTSYWCSIVTMALLCVVSEIFNVEKCRDLEIWARGHSRSLKVVPFDRLGMVSY